MSQRARYILIIVLLLILIGAGGFLIYYFSRQAGTQVGVDQGEILQSSDVIQINGVETPLGPNPAAGNPNDPIQTFPWLGNYANGTFTCKAFVNGQELTPAVAQGIYEQSPGATVNLETQCTNIDTVPHALILDQYTLQGLATDRDRTTDDACIDQDDIATQQFFFWPPVWTWGEHIFAAQRHWFTNDPSQQNCEFLHQISAQQGRNFNQIQEYIVDPGSFRVDFGAAGTSAATQRFDTKHTFTQCNFYQFDAIGNEIDPSSGAKTGRIAVLYGGVVRSADAAAECPNYPGGGTGEILVRGYNDFDGNGEYSDQPTNGKSEGTFFQAAPFELKDSSGQLVDETKCSNGFHLGGAGRSNCTDLALGTYTVEFKGVTSGMQGPLKEPHNVNGDNPLTVTLTAASPNVIADFGYSGEPTFGVLRTRIYEDLDKNSEYTDGATPSEGAVFFGTTYTLNRIQGTTKTPVNPVGICEGDDLKVGGVGSDLCFLPVGDYEVGLTNPTGYRGPIKEPHNPNGENPYRITMTAGGAPGADFGYLKGQGQVVTSQVCTVAKSVADQTTSNEGTPDDPHTSISAKGEQLLFTIAYTCPGTGLSAVVTDDYDDQLLTIDDASITASGVHDKTQKLISWTIPAASAASGTLSFKATIDSDLTVGSYTSTNLVNISRLDKVDDQDQTTTTISVQAPATANTPTTPTTPSAPSTGNTPVPITPTSPGTTPTTTPETGVGAMTLALILSLIVAFGLTVLAILRLPPARARR